MTFTKKASQCHYLSTVIYPLMQIYTLYISIYSILYILHSYVYCTVHTVHIPSQTDRMDWGRRYAVNTYLSKELHMYYNTCIQLYVHIHFTRLFTLIQYIFQRGSTDLQSFHQGTLKVPFITALHPIPIPFVRVPYTSLSSGLYKLTFLLGYIHLPFVRAL